MKGFGFVNDAAEREYRDLPREVVRDFGSSLRAIQSNERPFLPVTPLSSIGPGVIELKINGSPAFRCVYIAKYMDAVIVLHSFTKTTNGVDRQAMKVAEQRYKELMKEVRSK
ncbi:type II toxin-antitoxin system RelE/ParE family toxin [Pleionea litopenaei]|uniref:Type II toxin-antitoxin system RelE/ParE family toxin n=1 Tax=Pleionea litopenaei TaxID=3070815 RepID=A0AA51X9M2_9GAMM|nr:type II toxin-antitoxin system RelE/ParE family toxin [Pleionea sp. HL-JVS1]WMS89299.1 type II toxin-antitoxin system RelE/ParE family toxin [Pleionea sp. HL-JVS1]WMS89320.1 type II toxin-antitoxin system RelE/ParE family toxin [Pleionea sp. HL-JVS1]